MSKVILIETKYNKHQHWPQLGNIFCFKLLFFNKAGLQDKNNVVAIQVKKAYVIIVQYGVFSKVQNL